MRKSMFLAVALLLAGVFAFAPSSYAFPLPNIVAVGSSGVFTSVTIAMTQGDANSGFPGCGSHVWTAGTGKAWTATATDARPNVPAIPAEPGNIAVVWDTDVAPSKVCVYFSVDSIVGQRLFFATLNTNVNAATIDLPAAAQANAGANKVAFITDFCGAGPGCAGLPLDVWNIIDQGGVGVHPTVAFTDIRPEDAMYGYVRAACTPADEDGCLGYGGVGVLGFPLLSTFSTGSVANVVPYAIQNTDPLTGGNVPAFTTVPVGADPIMVIVSTADNTAHGGLGWLTTPGNSPYVTNIPSKTLAAIYAGRLAQTQDIAGVPIANSLPFYNIQREPLSGTYNTFEFQIPHSRDGNSSLSQETGFTPTSFGTNVVPPGPACAFVPPAAATYLAPPFAQTCSNPMNVPTPWAPAAGGFSRRFRAVGTGEMVAAVQNLNFIPALGYPSPLNDSIGYAFFGLGTFGGKTGIKYLTVDGVDPIFNQYASEPGGDLDAGGVDGSFAVPFCTGHFIPAPITFACTNPPTFAGLKAGNYRIYSLIRGTIANTYVEPATGLGAYHLIQAAQNQLAAIPDLVPFQVCAAACPINAANQFPAATVTLPIIRSHYGFNAGAVFGMPNGVTANNGTNAAFIPGGLTEAGGDMAGTIFYRVNDQDYLSTSPGGNSELQTWIQ
jgi:hypothetical protein